MAKSKYFPDLTDGTDIASVEPIEDGFSAVESDITSIEENYTTNDEFNAEIAKMREEYSSEFSAVRSQIAEVESDLKSSFQSTDAHINYVENELYLKLETDTASDIEQLKRISVPHTAISASSSATYAGVADTYLVAAITDHLAGEKLTDLKVYGNPLGAASGQNDEGGFYLTLRICGKNIFNPKQFLKASDWVASTVEDDTFGTLNTYSGLVSTLWNKYNKPGFNVPNIGKKLYCSYIAKNKSTTSYTTSIQYDYSDENTMQNVGYIGTKAWKKFAATTASKNISKIYSGYNVDDTVYFANVMMCDSTLDRTYEPYTETSVTAYMSDPLYEDDYIDFINKKVYRSDGTVEDITVEGDLTAIDSDINYIWFDAGGYSPEGIAPGEMEAEYYQDINKVITELKNAALAQGASV